MDFGKLGLVLVLLLLILPGYPLLRPLVLHTTLHAVGYKHYVAFNRITKGVSLDEAGVIPQADALLV